MKIRLTFANTPAVNCDPGQDILDKLSPWITDGRIKVEFDTEKGAAEVVATEPPP